MFSIRQCLLRIKRYLRGNLGVPFIVGFQILLLVCAGLAILGNSLWAEGLAVVAYFSLVIGVIVQLVSFMRHGKEAEEDDYGKNG